MFSILTVGLYLLAAGLWLLGLPSARASLLRIAMGVGGVAWFIHAWLLYQWIDVNVWEAGQNLYVSNVFSLILWCAILLVSVISLKRHKLFNVAVMFFPIAAASILLVTLLPGDYVLATGQQAGQLIHVLIAVATLSVLGVATLLAILIGIQDHMLKRKHLSRFFMHFPPLETMEKILFTFIIAGFIGLTLVITGSFLMGSAAGSGVQTHSPYLAVLAWLAFLILLLGRYLAAWRGKTMIVWTMVGVLILSLSYFGTWLLQG